MGGDPLFDDVGMDKATGKMMGDETATGAGDLVRGCGMDWGVSWGTLASTCTFGGVCTLIMVGPLRGLVFSAASAAASEDSVVVVVALVTPAKDVTAMVTVASLEVVAVVAVAATVLASDRSSHVDSGLVGVASMTPSMTPSAKCDAMLESSLPMVCVSSVPGLSSDTLPFLLVLCLRLLVGLDAAPGCTWLRRRGAGLLLISGEHRSCSSYCFRMDMILAVICSSSADFCPMCLAVDRVLMMLGLNWRCSGCVVTVGVGGAGGPGGAGAAGGTGGALGTAGGGADTTSGAVTTVVPGAATTVRVFPSLGFFFGAPRVTVGGKLEATEDTVATETVTGITLLGDSMVDTGTAMDTGTARMVCTTVGVCVCDVWVVAWAVCDRGSCSADPACTLASESTECTVVVGEVAVLVVTAATAATAARGGVRVGAGLGWVGVAAGVVVGVGTGAAPAAAVEAGCCGCCCCGCLGSSSSDCRSLSWRVVCTWWRTDSNSSSCSLRMSVAEVGVDDAYSGRVTLLGALAASALAAAVAAAAAAAAPGGVVGVAVAAAVVAAASPCSFRYLPRMGLLTLVRGPLVRPMPMPRLATGTTATPGGATTDARGPCWEALCTSAGTTASLTACPAWLAWLTACTICTVAPRERPALSSDAALNVLCTRVGTGPDVAGGLCG